MTNQPQDKIRAEFEATMRSKPNHWVNRDFYRDTLAVDLYEDRGTQAAWFSWQAACAQQSAQSQQDALDARLYRHLREYAAMSYPSCEGSTSKEAYLVVTGYGNVADPSIIDSAVKYEIATTQGASNV